MVWCRCVSSDVGNDDREAVMRHSSSSMMNSSNGSKDIGLKLGKLVSAKTFRAACCLTAACAFALGIVIGVLIPVYILPAHSSAHSRHNSVDGAVNNNSNNNSTWTWDNQIVAPPTVTTTTTTTTTRSSNGSVSQPSRVTFIQVDSNNMSRPVMVVNPASSSTTPDLAEEDVASEEEDVVSGVYWSSGVETSLPRPFDSAAATSWRDHWRKSTVVKVEEGCGRMQNRLLTLADGTKACCRYRQNLDQIQGEMFSFYLSRLLGVGNVVPSALGVVQPRNAQWTAVRSQLSLAQWADDRPVVLTRYLPDLQASFIPVQFRGPQRRLHPADVDYVSLNSSEDRQTVVQLAQWSDLVIFDYLTANLDRMVNNLYNLQWNPAMMEAPAHNLAQERASGLLVFLDNESGLLHGYRLLDKYEHYHRVMLDALCVFRRSTAKAIKRLHRQRNVGELLRRAFDDADPGMREFLPFLPEKNVRILNHRIDRVHEQITKCESLYRRTH